MKNDTSRTNFNRRRFFKILTTGGVAASLAPFSLNAAAPETADLQEKPETNIKDALNYPRNEKSMPGKFPGRVVHVHHENSVLDDKPEPQAAYDMVEKGMLALTGKKKIADAWRMFVSPGDRIGLKVNPIAGKSLTTSIEIVTAVIQQLESSGIPKENILIWDRREHQLHEAGFTADNFPGIKIVGTERKDIDGSFYDSGGKLYSEKLIDRDWYYYADMEGEYDAYTLPYMVNGGKYSYFTKICTQDIDKIINIPILKNAGGSVTLCMKNLAYGSITNTGRLHGGLYFETSAQVPAFPPIRDKVVLNIVDGIKGCFNGGPGANPQFFTFYKDVLIGTDPVAVDRIGYEIVTKKRIEEGLQKEEDPRNRAFMVMANEYGLGECELEKIQVKKIQMS